MSTVSHCKVNTLDKDGLFAAAESLGVELHQISENVWQTKSNGVKFTVNEDGGVKVSHTSDVKGSEKVASDVSKLGTYYAIKKKMKEKGFDETNTTSDPVLAIQANQELNLEFAKVSN